ncbi:elongation factor 1-beta [Candidatus Woesearchaeota archaeon]|nr:elongation factor 1-beta [Candidatus Woesearchaeota archaeon]
MARVVVTLRVMPESPSTNLAALQKAAEKEVAAYGGVVGKCEIEPIAFGLKALKVFFVMDEAKGATDPLEKKIGAITGVESVSVDDVRRAIG